MRSAHNGAQAFRLAASPGDRANGARPLRSQSSDARPVRFQLTLTLLRAYRLVNTSLTTLYDSFWTFTSRTGKFTKVNVFRGFRARTGGETKFSERSFVHACIPSRDPGMLDQVLQIDVKMVRAADRDRARVWLPHCADTHRAVPKRVCLDVVYTDEPRSRLFKSIKRVSAAYA